jgi:glutamate formiminotransferase
MPLVVIPNVSEGRSRKRVAALVRAVTGAGVRVLDVHSDALHNRSVLTCSDDDRLVDAMAALATAAETDLTVHEGAHPRLGGLDVCPFVPFRENIAAAVAAAHAAGAAIHARTGLPVYFYGEAALRPEHRELPDLRRGGLTGLIARAEAGLGPDLGGPVDPRRGVVCVGARGPLIAFNVTIAGTLEQARAVAAAVRARNGGLPGVRALGLARGKGLAQISCNLTAPERAGIDDAFEAIARACALLGCDVRATEIVGLVEERFLPRGEAARLLIQPGRSLESALDVS